MGQVRLLLIQCHAHYGLVTNTAGKWKQLFLCLMLPVWTDPQTFMDAFTSFRFTFYPEESIQKFFFFWSNQLDLKGFYVEHNLWLNWKMHSSFPLSNKLTQI